MQPVTKDQIRTFGRHVKREHPEFSRIKIWVEVGVRVLTKFLGSEWVKFYLGPEPHYFFKDFQNPLLGNEDGARRVYYIANALLNLQYVENFPYVLQELRDKHIEGGYAVLETARSFYSKRYPFRFVKPIGVKGFDYDMEALPIGMNPVPIECKSKLETTAISRGGILTRLREAKDQLPKGSIGAIFLRVPREWTGDDYLTTPFAGAANEILRNTSRVGLIVIQSDHMMVAEDSSALATVFREFFSNNPESEIAKRWDLVTNSVFKINQWDTIQIILGHISHEEMVRAENLSNTRFRGRKGFDG